MKAIFLLAMLLTCSACALSSPDAQMAKSQRRADQMIAALSQMTDPDSLAAAGLMSTRNHRDQSLSLMARAVNVAPNRADLVWLQAQQCGQLPPCDPEPIEHRLREIDPSNGAGWWDAMNRASAAHDTQAIDAALAAISRSERVDIYWTTLVAHLSRAVAKLKQMSLAESEVMVIGVIAAQAIPVYQHIVANCKGERLQEPGVTEVCRGVARALQNGDTHITEMIGVAVAKHVWPEDSPEWKAAVEERWVYTYRARFYPKIERRFVFHPGEYLTLCEQHRREQDVLAAQLTAAGYDPNPPVQ